MCGRTAQTQHLTALAAQNLGYSNSSPQSDNDKNQTSDTKDTKNITLQRDNYNLCPGMEATVFFRKDGEIRAETKTWGLLTRNGTKKTPLPEGKAAHFAALMFNARSETLYLKNTFYNLISKQQSCLVAVDGWFEWKQEVKGKKQPYFVKNKLDSKQQYCLFPGLWAEVATGRAEDPTLTTFTILTTDATPNLTWLHSRMPVCCWSKDLATKWLECPKQIVHEALLAENSKFCSSLEWYPVTTDMTNLAFRSEKAIAPLKRESVESFFNPTPRRSPNSSKFKKPNIDEKKSEPFVLAKKSDKKTIISRTDSLKNTPSSTSRKRPHESDEQSMKSAKVSKGSILSFFQPKK